MTSPASVRRRSHSASSPVRPASSTAATEGGSAKGDAGTRKANAKGDGKDGTETSQLLLSADDARESGKDIALAVPPPIDTAKLEPGDSFLATATVAEDGTMTLAGLTSDEHTKGADDATLALGDLKR